MARTSATTRESVKEAKKELTRFLKTLQTVPAEILTDEAPNLYKEILAETPYKTGKLEDSVRVKVSRDKKRPGINASASAKSIKGYDYSGIQHENDDYYHPIKGNAFYIANPFHRCVERIKRKMDKEVHL